MDQKPRTIIEKLFARTLVRLSLLLVILLGVLIWVLSQQPLSRANGLSASGTIKNEETSAASEQGGRIARIPVAEGDWVATGDTLVELDTEILDAQIQVQDATIDAANAALAKAKAGARPGQIAIAQAQLEGALASQLAARQAVTDTQAILANPQEINLQIATAQGQDASEEAQLKKAIDLKNAAEVGNNDYNVISTIRESAPFRDHLHNMPLDFYLLQNTYWQTWIGLNTVSAQKEGTEAMLAHLRAERANPQSIQSEADEAQSAFTQADAETAVARAQLSDLQAGASREQLDALQARIDQAQAARAALLQQRELTRIKAPIAGTVIELVAHPGEVAAPGAVLLKMTDPREVTLTVYVPEDQIGQVRLNQPVFVSVDSIPGRTFEGHVSHVSSQAEYTPRNVATQQERVNLVLAVDVKIPNANGTLKPGMAADARFGN